MTALRRSTGPDEPPRPSAPPWGWIEPLPTAGRIILSPEDWAVVVACHGPTTPEQLSDRCDLDPQRLWPAVDRLVDRGLVVRSAEAPRAVEGRLGGQPADVAPSVPRGLERRRRADLSPPSLPLAPTASSAPGGDPRIAPARSTSGSVPVASVVAPGARAATSGPPAPARPLPASGPAPSCPATERGAGGLARRVPSSAVPPGAGRAPEVPGARPGPLAWSGPAAAASPVARTAATTGAPAAQTPFERRLERLEERARRESRRQAEGEPAVEPRSAALLRLVRAVRREDRPGGDR